MPYRAVSGRMGGWAAVRGVPGLVAGALRMARRGTALAAVAVGLGADLRQAGEVQAVTG